MRSPPSAPVRAEKRGSGGIWIVYTLLESTREALLSLCLYSSCWFFFFFFRGSARFLPSLPLIGGHLCSQINLVSQSTFPLQSSLGWADGSLSLSLGFLIYNTETATPGLWKHLFPCKHNRVSRTPVSMICLLGELPLTPHREAGIVSSSPPFSPLLSS